MALEAAADALADQLNQLLQLAFVRRLHSLKGKDKGRNAIWVSGNWRMTFEFENGDAYVVDYEDYH